jgi:hypothetical protein
MDDQAFRLYAQDHMGELGEPQQRKLLEKVEATRQQRALLEPAEELDRVILGPLSGPRINDIKADQVFVDSFKDRSVEFAWIDPARVIALQVDVTLPFDALPEDETDLIVYALPHSWNIPVEISAASPAGPFCFFSSSPSIAANPSPLVEVDSTGRRLLVQPQKHVNLVQVVHMLGRYYVRNGHNRVLAAIKAGAGRLPALVVQGLLPQDLFLGNSP